MIKYNIEEGIDFYNELYKSLEINNDHEDTNICLITNQLLTDNFVNMYDDIFDARRNHKLSLETYKEAPKADVISREQELLFFEEYTQKQLNINDEPVNSSGTEQQ